MRLIWLLKTCFSDLNLQYYYIAHVYSGTVLAFLLLPLDNSSFCHSWAHSWHSELADGGLNRRAVKAYEIERKAKLVNSKNENSKTSQGMNYGL
jgi:hypothetical protein